MENTSTDIDSVYKHLKPIDIICEHCGHKIKSFIKVGSFDCPWCEERIDLE